MLFAIVKRFLDHPIDAGFDGIGKMIGHTVFHEFTLNAAAAQKIFELKLQGGNKTEVIQQSGPEQDRDVTDGLYGTLGHFTSAFQASLGGRRLSRQQRLSVGDFDLQEGQGLANFIVKLARKLAAALLFDLEEPGGKLLQFVFGLLDLSEVAVRAAFQVFGVAETEMSNESGEQHAETEHQQEALRGSAARGGELALAVLQALLVTGGEISQDVVELATAGDDFLLQKVDLRLIRGIGHGAGDRFQDLPEFAQAAANLRNHFPVVWGVVEGFQRLLILDAQRRELREVELTVGGSRVDEIVPDVNAGQP